MAVDHYILDASNNALTVTNLFGSNNPASTLGAVPLGTVGASATGELGTKVIIIGGSGGGALTDTELRATPVPVSLGTDTDVIGKVGIDQTTPGTTNGVIVNTIASITQTLDSAVSGAAVDVSRLSVVNVQTTAYSGDGLMRGQVSNDGANWTTITYYRLSDRLIGQNIAATGLHSFTTSGARFFRLLMVSWSSGSTTAIITGSIAGAPDAQVVDARNLLLNANAEATGSLLFIDVGGVQGAAGVQLYGWNGSSPERHHNNLAVALLASASRTTTQTSADITNINGRGIHVVLSTTTIGTGSITFSIQGKDANGIYYTILTGAAVVTDTVNRYTVFPTAAAVANVSINDILPRTFRIIITANNGNAAVYSVGYNLSV